MTVVRITKPILDELSDCQEEFLHDLFGERERVEGLVFQNKLISEVNSEYLTINRCVFNGCTFIDTTLCKAQLNDVVFNNCDLSNIHLDGSIFYRVEFVNCKLLGANYPETALNYVMFDNCIGRYINFTFSKWRTVDMKGCDLQLGVFNESKFSSVSFAKSNLCEAEFFHTSLKGIDLSESMIDGIQTNISDLRGAIVTSFQAIELSRLMGLVIKDR